MANDILKGRIYDIVLIHKYWKESTVGLHRYEKVMDVRKNLKVKVTFSPYLKERSFPVLQELIEEIARADYAAEMKE